MLHSIHIAGYRSLLDLSLKLAPLTIVQGANGVGKSNFYKALKLFASLADGSFPAAMAREGGTPGCFWAGEVPGPPRPKTVELTLGGAGFRWEVRFGLVPTSPGDPTAFRTDPDVKRERLEAAGQTYNRRRWTREIPHNESMLSYIRDAANYPGLATAREEVLSWRFYEGFRTDEGSPARQPSSRVWSPVLADDGSNLAAALQTISESSFPERLEEILTMAFPGHRLAIRREPSSLAIEWELPELKRPLEAGELSDGTLRFLALTAALLGPRPPSLLVLNEPENSLNPALFPALVRLIEYAGEASQVVVITHAGDFAELLAANREARLHHLVLVDGATRLMQDADARRVWRFDE